MGQTADLVGFAAGLRYSGLPDEVVAKAKDLFVNSWGVQLASSTLPWSKTIYRFWRDQGGTPQSTVVNYGDRQPALNAVFVNGTFAHGFELDDNHGRSGIKGGCVTVPAGLAVGELMLSSGTEFITALVAAYEVMLRVGVAARAGIVGRGHQPTATCGAIGSAIVAGRLMGLSEAALASALGSAAGQHLGYAEIPSGGRGHLKRTFGGMAGQAGVRAAFLAEAGLTAPPATLDGESGLLRSFKVGSGAARRLADGLGDTWEILRVHIKPYAQDGYIQPMSEAIDRIRARHPIRADEVESVWLGTNKRAVEEVIGPIREPKSLTDAQFSANFSVALQLVTGGAGFAEYREEALYDPRILELSQRVIVETDEEIDREHLKHGLRNAKVAIHLKNGEVYRETVAELRQMTSSDVDQKFQALAGVVLDERAAETLLATARAIEDVRDMSLVAGQLAGPGRVPGPGRPAQLPSERRRRFSRSRRRWDSSSIR
jgi:2-methylcitrate dehydratase PrpD